MTLKDSPRLYNRRGVINNVINFVITFLPVVGHVAAGAVPVVSARIGG